MNSQMPTCSLLIALLSLISWVDRIQNIDSMDNDHFSALPIQNPLRGRIDGNDSIERVGFPESYFENTDTQVLWSDI